MVGADDVLAAARRIRGLVRRTPLVPCEALGRLTGGEVWLKLETMQATGAFKERGAANRLALLSGEERARGVIAVSSGNHAQAVARHARMLGVSAVLVMPRTTPTLKAERTAGWGARVVLAGRDLAEAAEAALDIADREDRVFIHPYDDPAVIAGQGTVALEIAQDLPQLDAVFAPVGGGGLLAGCVSILSRVRPGLELVGVQAGRYASMVQALAGRPRSVEGGPTLADGIAVAQPGGMALEMLSRHRIAVATASEVRIAQAVALLAREAKLVAEGAGAIGLAPILEDPARFAGRRVAVVISGGNIAPAALAEAMAS
jgi:threonine dehydratase